MTDVWNRTYTKEQVSYVSEAFANHIEYISNDGDPDGMTPKFVAETSCKIANLNEEEFSFIWSCLSQERLDLVHIDKEMSNEQERVLVNYFLNSEGLKNYNVCGYTRLNPHNEMDSHLFIVTGYNRNTKNYTVWSSWNTKTESLNHGHYGLTAEQAKDLVAELRY